MEPSNSERSVVVRTVHFEKPIAELEATRAQGARGRRGRVDLGRDQKARAEGKGGSGRYLRQAHAVAENQQVAHPERPHCLDYISALIEDFTPLAGDRYFAEDEAIMGGLGASTAARWS